MDADSSLLLYMNSCFIKLSRFFYRLNSKLHKGQNRRLYRITFKKTSGLAPTYLFLKIESKMVTKQMKFSIEFNEYYTEVWLSPRCEFNIIQKSQNFLVDSFPQIQNSEGKLVNMIPEPRTFKSFILSPKIFRSFNTKYFLDSSGCSVGKLFYLNEDAFFCNESALGVADGIGSLKTEFGISSRDFSHELMVKCDQYSRVRGENLQNHMLNCKEVIKQAYNSLESGGSSTFLLALLSGRQMNILNLGDCGLILIRNDGSFKIVFQTTAKVHSFNTPYQLTRRFSLKQLTEGNHSIKNIDKSDDINDSDEFMITTLPGDYVVMGSDGLWDNLYPTEILKILEQYKHEPVHKIAAIITKIAKIRAIGISKTPFSVLHKASGKGNYIGGKIDDITVVVAKVLVR